MTTQDVCKGFRIEIRTHTPALNAMSPERIREVVAMALEHGARMPQVEEEIDFTLEVSRIYEK